MPNLQGDKPQLLSDLVRGKLVELRLSLDISHSSGVDIKTFDERAFDLI
jgi:hypothetical protein